jgi:hypothetical protein
MEDRTTFARPASSHSWRRVLIAALILASVASVGFAQNSDVFTDGFANGHWWKSNTRNENLNYIAGMNDGMRAQATMDDKKMTGVPKGYKIIDYVLWIDQFYNDPANIQLPVIAGWQWTSAKLLGMSEADLKDLLENWRKPAEDEKPAPAPAPAPAKKDK